MSMIGNYRRVTRNDIATLRADSSLVSGFLYDEEPPPGMEMDVDKAWHAIHFLLNGHTWEGTGPLYDAVLGGLELGEEDVGYGPARLLTPREVKLTSEALQRVDVPGLLTRIDAQALSDNEIYPQSWTGDAADREYIEAYFLQVVEFFKTAAENDEGLLLFIN